uniref:Helix-turn-helix domain-containing protein n=1 Tax=uncultured prokaryote TaxID=198431 RepID=A0A0H5PYF5_9ZZZZ|nr:hypothetical protein [uncultured prokaryote]
MSGEEWSSAEAAKRCGVSRATMSRRLTAGEIPGARKTPGGWKIPPQSLAVLGMLTEDTTEPEAATEDTTATTTAAEVELAELRGRLEIERARRQAAEQLAAERAARIEDLRHSLLALAPPPPTTEATEAEKHPAGNPSQGETPGEDNQSTTHRDANQTTTTKTNTTQKHNESVWARITRRLRG